MTDRGSVDLSVEDFARFPVFAAHDEYGLEGVRLASA